MLLCLIHNLKKNPFLNALLSCGSREFAHIVRRDFEDSVSDSGRICFLLLTFILFNIKLIFDEINLIFDGGY